MKKRTNRQYAEAFYDVAKSLSKKDLPELSKNFIAMLVKHQKLKQAKNIINEIIKYHKKKEGIKEIEITFARDVDNKILEKIKNVFGEKVEATTFVDPKILGGIKIKTDDKILDASLSTQLKKLKESLV